MQKYIKQCNMQIWWVSFLYLPYFHELCFFVVDTFACVEPPKGHLSCPSFIFKFESQHIFLKENFVFIMLIFKNHFKCGTNIKKLALMAGGWVVGVLLSRRALVRSPTSSFLVFHLATTSAWLKPLAAGCVKAFSSELLLISCPCRFFSHCYSFPEI